MHADAPLDLQSLLDVMQAAANGDLTVRLPADRAGMEGQIAQAFNDIVTADARLAAELKRVGREVGSITEQVRRARAAREAERSKDQFLAALSHELRTPLASIRNVVEIMRVKEGDPSTTRWGRDVIERQVGYLVRLVDDLLDVSRSTMGKLKLRMEPVDLASAVALAVEACRPLIEDRQHTLEVELGEQAIWVRGDLVRLTQVITNLLNNAAKFQDPGGTITLTIRRVDSNALLFVQDRGLGIPPGKLRSLFEVFSPSTGVRGDEESGQGLGLSLVRRLVELHAGSVEVRSEGLGRGSEFIVRLPCLTNHRAAKPAQLRVIQRILVVDDNLDSAESLAILLRSAGHDVALANDGESALRLAPSVRPSVVLLDLGMPGMNGLELCRRLRLQGLGEAFIVAVTGYDQESDRTRTREAGFDRHVVKPIACEELLELVGAVASAGRRPA